MKIKYSDFLKLYEQKESIISLLEVESVIKNIFNDTKVSSVASIYERDEKTKKLKLIITINNLFYEKTNVIQTKFIFLVDDDKKSLLENKFFYLYEINCDFKEVNFDDADNLETKLNKIINERDFGIDIKNLSDINVTMAGDVNDWLRKNGVDSISIYSITYHPIMDNLPCESLSFKFEINLDDERLIEMRFKKTDKKNYKITFKEGDWFDDVTIPDVKGLVQAIGKTLKNNIA